MRRYTVQFYYITSSFHSAFSCHTDNETSRIHVYNMINFCVIFRSNIDWTAEYVNEKYCKYDSGPSAG